MFDDAEDLMSTDSSLSDPNLDFYSGEHYHVVLLDTSEHSTRALSYLDENGWILPCFEYAKALGHGDGVPTVCNDFKSWLKITNDDIYFTASVELIGGRWTASRIDPENLGRAQMLLLEPHGITNCEIELPTGAAWKDVEFVQNTVSLSYPPVGPIMAKAIVSCMDDSSSYLESLSDERYRPGWFESASRYFVELVSSRGAKIESRVFQTHMSCTSTMLQLQSSLGRYFLKSPARGCNETEITAVIAELFPDASPNIVGVSNQLNCFVSEEFDTDEPVDIRDAVMALGKLQVESINHVKLLCEAGCPVRDMEGLERAVKEWPQEYSALYYKTDTAETIAPVIEGLCKELKEYRIPMTLVHGDFSTSNMGFKEHGKKRNLIFFDWEYAYIGHPFCDFHRVRKKVSPDVLDEYLGLWSDYEDIEHARCAYEVANKLAIAIRAWSFLEWAKECNAQDPPHLATFAYETADTFEEKFCL